MASSLPAVNKSSTCSQNIPLPAYSFISLAVPKTSVDDIQASHALSISPVSPKDAAIELVIVSPVTYPWSVIYPCDSYMSLLR